MDAVDVMTTLPLHLLRSGFQQTADLRRFKAVFFLTRQQPRDSPALRRLNVNISKRRSGAC